MINCEIRDNTSLKRGGGIATRDDLTVLNTIIVGNEGAEYGGGIEAEGPSVTIVNCTIADNTATILAGGVWFIEGDALIVNSILWGNTDSNGASQIGLHGTDEETLYPLSVAHSDVEDGSDSGHGVVGLFYDVTWDGSNIDVDPLFDDAGAGNYRLQLDSPCIDAADTDIIDDHPDEFDIDEDADFTEITPDLDLMPRVAGLAVDMGAYESECFCSADITGPGGPGNPDGNVDSLDFLLMNSQWSSPCTGSCEADITGPSGVPEGNVDSLDFLLLNGQWGSPGNCPGECPTYTSQQEMLGGGGSEGGPSEEDWAALLDELFNASSESASMNGLCWILHYLDGCGGGACAYDECPGSDPLSQH